jgi:antitoxin YefM
MILEYGFSDARSQFTGVIDQVQDNLPLLIRRRKSSEDDTLLISASLFSKALKDIVKAGFRTDVILEADDSVTVTLAPFNFGANGATREEAVDQLIDDVILYSEEYLRNRGLYLMSSNRREHLPYIIQVLLCHDKEEIKELLKIA